MSKAIPPIIISKFAETFFRSLFILLCSFSLDPRQAGIFGIFVTVQGLASFFLGYERYIDIQRSYDNNDAQLFLNNIADVRAFFFFNYLILLLPLSLTLYYGLGWGVCLIVAVYSVAILEQILSFSYQVAVVSVRHTIYVHIAACMRVALALGAVSMIASGPIHVEELVIFWLLVLCINFFLLLVVRFLRKPPMKISRENGIGREFFSIGEQYKRSFFHFLIGMVAILTLQLDRVIIGARFSYEDFGIYYRHILISAAMYQIFNIASYNRILPSVFDDSRSGDFLKVRRKIRREYGYVCFVIVVLSAISTALLFTVAEDAFSDFGLNMFLIFGLVLVSVIRIRADFNGLVFHACRYERLLFYIQSFTLVFSGLCLYTMSMMWGMFGAALAMGCSAMCYLVLTSMYLNKVVKAQITPVIQE